MYFLHLLLVVDNNLPIAGSEEPVLQIQHEDTQDKEPPVETLNGKMSLAPKMNLDSVNKASMSMKNEVPTTTFRNWEDYESSNIKGRASAPLLKSHSFTDGSLTTSNDALNTPLRKAGSFQGSLSFGSIGKRHSASELQSLATLQV